MTRFGKVCVLSALTFGTASGAAPDATSLLQGVVGQHIAEVKRDACTCLPWADVFNDRGVECGTWYPPPITPSEADAHDAHNRFMERECQLFWTKLQTNDCVRVHPRSVGFGSGFTESDLAANWCYVSEDCKELNGGSAVEAATTNTSWKKCGDTDAKLGDKNPDELQALVTDNDVLMMSALTHAYPLSPQSAGGKSLSFPEHQSYWKEPELPKSPDLEELRDMMQATPEKVYLIDSWGHQLDPWEVDTETPDDYAVAWGMKLFECVKTGKFRACWAGGDMNEDEMAYMRLRCYHHPGQMYRLKCTSGCDDDSD